MTAPEHPPPRRACGDPRWSVVAALIFALACLFLFRGMIGSDLREVVPANVATPMAESRGEGDWDSLAETDLRFVVWLISRNAWTILHRPLSLFDAEQCHPAAGALTLGEPGIALGLVAAPLRLVLGDPVLTFNATLVVMTALAFLAAFLLVREWTGSPPAGIVAGLLYAFGLFKIGDVVHLIVWDGTWTVFALHFATRLFREGRTRDAVLLAAAVGMQLAGSLYPLLGAVLIGLPVLAWLVVQHGVRRAGVVRLGAVALSTLCCAALVFVPYLTASAEGEIVQSPFLAFFAWSYVTPGGEGFAGWLAVGLLLAALGLGRRHGMAEGVGDPRWVMLAAGVVLFAIAIVGDGGAGGRTVPIVRGETEGGGPNLYLLLASWVPGLDVVRGPGAFYGGVHLVICVLAGVGAAALLRVTPARYGVAGAAVLLLLTGIEVSRPPFLGLSPRFEWVMVPVRPDPAALALFDELEAAGDSGPLIEYPMNRIHLLAASKGLLLTSYHHRPTSYCYNSFVPSASAEVERIARSLPDETSLAGLYRMGFRTLIVHHEPGVVGGPAYRERFRAYAARSGGPALTPLAANDSLSAYRIEP